MKLKKSTEKEIQNSILEYMNYQSDCYAFQINTTGVYDPAKQVYRKTGRFVVKGQSDIFAVYRGRFIAIEVKTLEGFERFTDAPRPHEMRQAEFLKAVNRCGGVAVVVHSLIQVIQLFAYLDAEEKV